MNHEPKDRAAEVSAGYGWRSYAECLNAQAMFRQATQEVLAAVVEHTGPYQYFGVWKCGCGLRLQEAESGLERAPTQSEATTAWQAHIQSLTINSTSLEKFAEGIRKEEREAFAEQCKWDKGYEDGHDAAEKELLQPKKEGE